MSAVSYTLHGRSATIRLDNPRAGNPLDLSAVAELATAVRQARTDDAAVVVLASTGRYFSVGGDLEAFAAAHDMSTYVDDVAEAVHRAILDLQQLDAIVVAAVQGPAAGGAVPLAAAADLVVASDSASFTLAYTRIGLTPDGSSTLLWTTLGMHRLLHWALRNTTMTAEQALDAGLVSAVHAPAELDEAVDTLVADLLAGPRRAQVTAKRLIRAQAQPHPAEAMRRETLAIRRAAAGPEGTEGVAAFLSKRPPDFAPRDR